jgi:uncharacterized protein YkwD
MTPWLRGTALGLIGGLALALIVCSALAPAEVLARSACPGENAPISGTPAPDLRASVLCLVNETRLEHGLPALRQDPRLESSAQEHSSDMVARQYFAHTAVDGRSFDQRVTAAGYEWSQTGENIAAGQTTPAVVMEAWMNSKEHCVNILAPGFRDIGVGVDRGAVKRGIAPGTWTQDFGRSRVEPPPSTNTGPQAACPLSLSEISAGPAPTTPASVAPPSSPSASLAGPVDRTAPQAILFGSRSQKLGKTVRVRVSCPSEACTANVGGTVGVPKLGAARSRLYKLENVTASIAKAGRAGLSPALSSPARRAIRRALRRGRRITVSLKITVSDAARNTRTLKRQIKLRL